MLEWNLKKLWKGNHIKSQENYRSRMFFCRILVKFIKISTFFRKYEFLIVIVSYPELLIYFKPADMETH